MSAIVRFLFIAVGFMLAVSLSIIPSIQKVKEVERKAQVMIGSQVIVAEMARTAQEREKGLSGVRYLNVNEGMLFVYDEKDYHSIWMKGMRVPIDIIWISGNQVVGFEENVLPEPGKDISELEIYRPPEPVDRILELRAGRVGLLDVEIGDTIEIKKIVPNGV